jgi:hypothetical protein
MPSQLLSLRQTRADQVKVESQLRVLISFRILGTTGAAKTVRHFFRTKPEMCPHPNFSTANAVLSLTTALLSPKKTLSL